MKTQFNKNVFFSNVMIHAAISIDMTNCQQTLLKISLMVIQVLRTNTVTTNHVLLSSDFTSANIGGDGMGPLILARAPEFVCNISLDLNSIRNTIPMEKQKTLPDGTEITVPLTEDEKTFYSTLAGACHTQYITNSYFLQAQPIFDGCACNPAQAQQMPISIIPVGDPASFGFPEPVGYAPIDMGYFKMGVLHQVPLGQS